MSADNSTKGAVLGVQDVAKLLGISPRQLRAAIHNDVLPKADVNTLPSFALSGYSKHWLENAKRIQAEDPYALRRITYGRRQIVVKIPKGVFDLPAD